MAGIVFIYVNHPDADGAAELARSLVEARLAASVNILPQTETIYRWNEQVQAGCETVLIVKTMAALVEQVTAHVRDRHPYQCPCIAALDVTAAPVAYLDWMAENTAVPPSIG